MLAWVGVAVGSGGCSAAQPVPDMSARFYSVHTAMQASGLTQMGAVSRGRLAVKQSVSLPLELSSECLTVVALGERGVEDLVLSLRDTEGKEIARDDMLGPDASLRFCPDKPGKHELVVMMAKGTGGYAVSTWTGGTPSQSTEATQQGTTTVEGGGTCEAPTVIVAGQTYVGDTENGHQMEDGSCGNSAANELVYRLDLPSRQRVTIDVRAQYDAVLYVRRGECADPDAEVACNDDAPGGGRRSRVDEVLDPGTYFVFVDGYGEEEGAFRMTVRMRPAPTSRSECETAPVLAMHGVVRGSTRDRVSNAASSCGNHGPGPDRPFRLDLASRSRVRITEQARLFSPVVHVRRLCERADSEVGCSSDGMTSHHASFVAVLDPGDYFVFADSVAETASGDFVLETETTSEQGGGAIGDTCGEAVSLSSEVSVMEGDTFEARDDVRIGCGTEGASEVMFRLDLLRKARFTARIRKEEGAHKVALQRVCGVPDEELVCGKAVDHVLAPGTYFLVVEDVGPGTFGRFELGYRIQDVTAAENACKAASSLVPGRPFTGSITAADNRFTASCAGPIDSQLGPDRVHTFRLAKRSKVTLNLQSGDFQPVLSLRRDCLDASSEMGCRVLSRRGASTELERILNPGTYFVFVDSREADSEGSYTLNFQTEEAR